MVWPLNHRKVTTGNHDNKSAADGSLVAVRRARLAESARSGSVTLGEVLACWRHGARADQMPVTGLGPGDPVAGPDQQHVLYDDFARFCRLGQSTGQKRGQG